jgi:hypothetical protein
MEPKCKTLNLESKKSSLSLLIDKKGSLNIVKIKRVVRPQSVEFKKALRF